MKNNFYKVLAALIVFALTACQATPAAPTENPAIEFFKGQEGRWISVRPPTGWVAKPGGTSTSPSVIVTDDWEGYQKTNTRAVGIIILPLVDKGSAEDVLLLAVGRFSNLLTTPTTKVTLEQAAGQSYAWVEYQGKSAEKENTLAYYFFAVISTDQRSVLVFTSMAADQQKSVRPAYQSTVKALTLH